MSNSAGRNPYAPCVLESHLCARCGLELRHIAATPDPIYGLPVCVCPGCGLATVRRKHRLRTFPVGFRRLDRAFNRLAFAAGCVVLFAVSSLMISLYMASQAEARGTGPFAATFSAIRNAPPEELLSYALATASVGMVIAISGITLSRLLWHWNTKQLLVGWACVLGLLALTPMVPILLDIDTHQHLDRNQWLSLDLTRALPNRLQAMALCWAATSLGIAIDRGTRPELTTSRRFRRSLRWARKRLARRRAG